MTITAEQLAAVKKPAKRKPVARKKSTRTKKKTTKATIRVDRTKFCQELIKNSMCASKAYQAVCPKVTNGSAKTLGNRLLTEVDTIEILTPMLKALFVDAGIEADYIFKRWLEIAEGSAADYFTFDGGYPRLDMSDMTPAQRANLKKITITPGQFGTKYSIETYDAQRAVSEIAKHLGLLVEKLDDKDIDRIGDLIEMGVARIKKYKDLDAWKSITFESEPKRT